jgi:hypothetical protein
MPVATVLVHQLRYLLAYGPRAGHELAEQGDAYVHSLLPWLVALVLPLFLGALVLALARSTRASRPDGTRPPRVPVLWAGALVALLAGSSSRNRSRSCSEARTPRSWLRRSGPEGGGPSQPLRSWPRRGCS